MITPVERLRLDALRSDLAGPFSLAVAGGECVVITGASGAGKSLFLRMIADLDPNQGHVWLDGRERASFTGPEWRRQAVYNAAEPGWWSETVADHFNAGRMGFARRMAPLLDLPQGVLDGPVLRLSSGERQRLGLIRALALASPVLLLDEPTGALDETSTSLVEAVLRERMAAGTALLIVTHSEAQAGRMGHRHLRMVARKLVPPEAIPA